MLGEWVLCWWRVENRFQKITKCINSAEMGRANEPFWRESSWITQQMGSDGLWRNQANTPPNPCTGVINKRVQRIWSSKLPMKLKSSYGRSVVTSSKLGWNWKREIGNTATFVGFCGCPETVEHICFTCVLAKFTWVYFKEALGWERVLRNLQDFP